MLHEFLQEFDPSITALAVLLTWQITRSAVFLTASAVCLLSKDPARRAEARRVLRILTGRPPTRT